MPSKKPHSETRPDPRKGSSPAASVPQAVPPHPVDAANDDIQLELSPDEQILDAPSESDADATSVDDGDSLTSPNATRKRFLVRRDINKRLDKYLADRLRGASRNKIQKLIDLGGVTVNDRPAKAALKIRANDVIDVILPPKAVRHILPEPIPLDVLYEDEHFIVLNKQANLIVHPARGNTAGTLVNGLAYHFLQTGQIRAADSTTNTNTKIPTGAVAGLSGVGAADFRPGIIHRLDKNTTGVIVVGKNDESHWQIARQFEDRSTLKAYLAIVHGQLEGPGGAIDQPIGKHPTIREAFAVRHDPAGKQSLTLYRVRERYKGYCLVELELKTGRTHQIRVHLSYLGHPIVGDIVYGGEPIGQHELEHPPIPAGSRRMMSFARERDDGEAVEAKAKARKDLILAHPALHASLLRFVHPMRKEPMTFIAPMHEPMATLIRELRQQPEEGPVAEEGYWVDLTKILREEKKATAEKKTRKPRAPRKK